MTLLDSNGTEPRVGNRVRGSDEMEGDVVQIDATGLTVKVWWDDEHLPSTHSWTWFSIHCEILR